MLSLAQFRQVTGEVQWPDYLEPHLRGGALEYFCNTCLDYEVRGVHVRLATRWDWEAPAGGGDCNNSAYRGSRAVLAIRQEAAGNGAPNSMSSRWRISAPHSNGASPRCRILIRASA